MKNLSLELQSSMTCKADSWDHIEAIREGELLNSDLRVIESFPRISARAAYTGDLREVTPTQNFAPSFKAPAAFGFVLVFKDREFLVNTEGYDYARYMIEIV